MKLMESYLGTFWVAKLVFQRALACIYLIAFIVALNQFPALLGHNGLEPAPKFLQQASFSQAPSIFQWHYSDAMLKGVAWAGIFLSLIALSGLSERGPIWVSMATWLLMWVLYLSIVNIGGTFYSFGWESMLLEAGFFAAFLGPVWMKPSLIPMMILRWMLFRVEIGAGLIKIRAGGCWHDLTCLFYHHETQPLPNPLSYYAHHIPKILHKGGVVFSHFVQLVVPFGLFGPQRIAAVAGGLIVFHQFLLIFTGNYSWLNWLTVILGVTAFSDMIFGPLANKLRPSTTRDTPAYFQYMLYALGVAAILLSIQPTLNLFSSRQLMNYSYNRYHLVNTYGAFGSVTKTRYEVVIEGTGEKNITPSTEWKEYGFRAKPGDVNRMPPQIAPYHLRLDWLVWFLPFSVQVTPHGIYKPGYQRWYLNFIQKLLEGDKKTLKLIRHNPFPEKPPEYIRARYYEYHFTTPEEKKETGAWWRRSLVDEYMPPVRREDLE